MMLNYYSPQYSDGFHDTFFTVAACCILIEKYLLFFPNDSIDFLCSQSLKRFSRICEQRNRDRVREKYIHTFGIGTQLITRTCHKLIMHIKLFLWFQFGFVGIFYRNNDSNEWIKKGVQNCVCVLFS